MIVAFRVFHSPRHASSARTELRELGNKNFPLVLRPLEGRLEG